jgi:hypothetical protein
VGLAPDEVLVADEVVESVELPHVCGLVVVLGEGSGPACPQQSPAPRPGTQRTTATRRWASEDADAATSEDRLT